MKGSIWPKLLSKLPDCFVASSAIIKSNADEAMIGTIAPKAEPGHDIGDGSRFRRSIHISNTAARQTIVVIGIKLRLQFGAIKTA